MCSISHLRGVSLGMPAEPGGRERAAGKQWARHLSCVAALPSTHNGARRVASGAFLFRAFLSGDSSAQNNGSFVPSLLLPTFNPSNLLRFLRAFLFLCKKIKQNARISPSSATSHYHICHTRVSVSSLYRSITQHFADDFTSNPIPKMLSRPPLIISSWVIPVSVLTAACMHACI